MKPRDIAAKNMESYANLIRSGEATSAILISFDEDMCPTQMIYLRGDSRLRLVAIGALHEAIRFITTELDADSVRTAPAAEVLH